MYLFAHYVSEQADRALLHYHLRIDGRTSASDHRSACVTALIRDPPLLLIVAVIAP